MSVSSFETFFRHNRLLVAASTTSAALAVVAIVGHLATIGAGEKGNLDRIATLPDRSRDGPTVLDAHAVADMPTADRELSGTQLLAIFHGPISCDEARGREKKLVGQFGGVRVRTTFRCSEECTSLARIPEYDLGPVFDPAACGRVGGVVVTDIPGTLGSAPLCVPGPIASELLTPPFPAMEACPEWPWNGQTRP